MIEDPNRSGIYRPVDRKASSGGLVFTLAVLAALSALAVVLVWLIERSVR